MVQRNPFLAFPTTRGPLKLLVYGDPGTEKTRRALQMPGPLYVIDMENGAADYGDLVDPDRDFYLATKSHVEVKRALDYLSTLPPEKVGTLIIDPITVVWQSLQQGHIERQVRKSRGKLDPEQVVFDVGTWGKLKRTYGDIMSTLLSAPYHVVMIARGKEQIDEKGRTVGYKYEGEKSTEFLASVVVQTRRGHDLVEKDRTGTFQDGERRKRIDFTAFLEKTTRTPHRMQTESEAAAQDSGLGPDRAQRTQSEERKRPQKRQEQPASGDQPKAHPSWRQAASRFCKDLAELVGDFTDRPYDAVADWCESLERPRPSQMDNQRRQDLLAALKTDKARSAFADWCAAEGY